MKPIWQVVLDNFVTVTVAGVLLLPVANYLVRSELDRHIQVSGGDVDARMLKQTTIDLRRDLSRAEERIARHCDQIQALQNALRMEGHYPGAQQRLREKAGNE